jgi:hypothetical protein
MDDDEAMLTGEVPELPEFTEALIGGSFAPRFVQLDGTYWVNPEHVRAVEASTPDEVGRSPRECWVHLDSSGPVMVTRSADEVIALLTADPPPVDPNQLEIPGVR